MQRVAACRSGWAFWVLSFSILVAGHSPKTFAQAPNPSQRFDVVIGAMCIGDMPFDARAVERRIQQGNDVYEDWVLVWSAPGGNASKIATSGKGTKPPTQPVPGKLPGTVKPAGDLPKSSSKQQSISRRPKAPGNLTVGQDAVRPIIRFFRQQLPNAPGTSCREMKGDVLLSGDVEKIRLSARTSAPGNSSPAQIVVSREGLSVTVAHVRSGLAPLFGGRLDLSGSKAWIEQYVPLRGVEGQPPEGAIEITSWARRIKDAKFVLQPGATPIALNMSSSKPNVTIKVPLDGKYTELIDGGFTGSPPAIAVDEFKLPSITFSKAFVDAGTLTVERLQRRETTIVLSQTSVRYEMGRITTNQTTATLVSAGSASIDRIASSGQPSANAIQLQDSLVHGVLAKGAECAAQVSSTNLVKAAACTARIARSSSTSAEVDFATEDLRSLGFDHAFNFVPTTTLAYKVEQQGNKEIFSGRLAPASAKLGALRFGTLQELTLRATPLSAGAVRIPISIELPSASGQVSIERGGNEVVLSGKVERLKLNGTLSATFDVNNPWALIVEPNNLNFAASALVSVTPLLYGGETQLAGAGIAFVNSTQVSLTKSRRSGQVLFSPSVLTVLDPKMELAKTKEGITIRAPARFEASPTLAINLENGGVSVRAGKLLVENASATTSQNGVADLGDVRVTAGEVAFQRLAVNYENGAGLLRVSEFRAVAEKIASIGPDKGGHFADQVQWSGRPSQPIRIASFEATIAPNDSQTALRISDYTLRDFCTTIAEAQYGDPSGFSVAAENLKICAAILGTNAIRAELELNNGKAKGQVDSVSGNLHVIKLALRITGGTPAKPAGSGQLTLGPLNLAIPTPVEIKQSCIGVPDFKKIPARTKFSGQAAVAALKLTDGQLSGAASVLMSEAKLESTDSYDCRGELINWLLIGEKRVVYDYPCPTWRKPFRMCQGWTVLVPEIRVTIDSRLRIYKLLVNYLAPATELRLRSENGKAKVIVCLGSVNMTTPLVASSYIVQPRTNVPGFDRLMGDVLGVIVAPFESALITALGNVGALLLNFLDATGIQENCLK